MLIHSLVCLRRSLVRLLRIASFALTLRLLARSLVLELVDSGIFQSYYQSVLKRLSDAEKVAGYKMRLASF